MTRRVLYHAFGLTLLLAAAIPALAAPKNAKSTYQLTGNTLAKGTFNVIQHQSLGGVALEPGAYTVIASDTQVSFLASGRIVAQAPIQWKDTVLTGSNAIVDDSGSIREIRFKGKRRSAAVL